jgi:hypothetical protein
MAKKERIKPHIHFCTKCRVTWECDIEKKENCQRDDGFECLECVLEEKKKEK